MDEDTLEREIKDLAIKEGSDLVGICSAESIKDKEFSDPRYKMPDAQSVISIAVKFDDENVKKYLSKEDHEPLRLQEGLITRKLIQIGKKIAAFLDAKGYRAIVCEVNFDYRNVDKKNKAIVGFIEKLIDLINKEKDPNYSLSEREAKELNLMKTAIFKGMQQNPFKFVPELSHKCVAEAAGLGRIGWSGNLVTKEFGARVLLNSVLTNAKLTPDKPLDKNPCILCKLCEKSCQGGLFKKDESQQIKIAGIEEIIGKRNSVAYCVAMCGGFIGQNRFKGWSTWSPFRIEGGGELPTDESVDNFVRGLLVKALKAGGKEAENVLRLVKDNYFGLDENKPLKTYYSTCACCQLVCGASLKEKKESYYLLVNSGCVK